MISEYKGLELRDFCGQPFQNRQAVEAVDTDVQYLIFRVQITDFGESIEAVRAFPYDMVTTALKEYFDRIEDDRIPLFSYS